MEYKETLSGLVKARVKLDWYLEELKSPSEETKKMEDKFFEELEEVEQEYIEAFQKAKNILGKQEYIEAFQKAKNILGID